MESKITQEYFEKKCAEFEIKEERAKFYEMARNQSMRGYKAEACVILMGTWNFAAWRYGVKEFDKNKYDLLMPSLEPIFVELSSEIFETADYAKLEEKINKIYGPLSKIKGIEYTGATKLMLVENPNLFMPWDHYIREHYSFGKDGRSYSLFMKKMQEEYGALKAPTGKTLPKAVDEFNYITISLPALKKEKKRNEKARENRKKELEEFKAWKSQKK